MIISKTPYRISLFGGGTDYREWFTKNGGDIISTTINKYIYITCRELPSFFEHKHRVVYSIIENAKKTENIKLNVVREAIKYLKIKHGLEIHYDGDLPAKSGMGSSSSFVVGILNALNNFKNINLNKKNLSDKSINFERNILREIVGIQDQIAASYGGFNHIKIKKSGKYTVVPVFKTNKDLKKLDQNLFLIYTKVKRKKSFVINYVPKLNYLKKEQMKFIQSSVKNAKDILKEKDFDSIGSLLHETWIKKKELSKIVSNSKLDNLYFNAIKSGATGGKLLGAGGGGFFLFYVPMKNQKKFLLKFKKNLLIPFKCTNHGSKIILNNND